MNRAALRLRDQRKGHASPARRRIAHARDFAVGDLDFPALAARQRAGQFGAVGLQSEGLFSGVAAKASIAGLAMVEFVPERDDVRQLSALTAARLVAVTMGLMSNSGA